MSKHSRPDDDEPERRVVARTEDRPLPLALMDLPDDMLVDMITALASETQLAALWHMNQRMRGIIDAPGYNARIWAAFEQRFMRGPLGLPPARLPPHVAQVASRARFHGVMNRRIVEPLSLFLWRSLTDRDFAMGTAARHTAAGTHPTPVSVRVEVQGHDAAMPPMVITTREGLYGTARVTHAPEKVMARHPRIRGEYRMWAHHHAGPAVSFDEWWRAYPYPQWAKEDFGSWPGDLIHGRYFWWLQVFAEEYGHDTAVTIRIDAMVPGLGGRLSWRTMSMATGMHPRDVEEPQ